MTLVEKHWGLVRVVVASLLKNRKYYKYRKYSDDLMGVAALALAAAGKSFDPNRGVLFRTYASAKMRGELFSEIRRISKIEYHEVHINEYICSTLDPEEPDAAKREKEEYELVDALEPEDEYEKAIYLRTILHDEGVKPIAKDFKKGPTTVRRTRNMLLERLENKLKENK